MRPEGTALQRWILAFLAAFALSTSRGAAAEGGILVIANPRVPVASVSIQELAAIYLLRFTIWPDGQPIVPVNRRAGSTLRKRFSRIVLKQPPLALANYWTQMYYEGKNPPLILGSDRDVVLFVRKVPGAIGYVHTGVATEGTKILAHFP